LRRGDGELVAVALPLEFNRFEVTIQRDRGMVLLEDVLDASEAASCPFSRIRGSVSRYLG
jgi:hypothetical protein